MSAITLKKTTIIKRILIRCPATAKLATTGLTIDQALFEKTKFRDNKLTCPHCAGIHSWTKKDVVLAR